jgi:membrane fusion protein, multidrug efflux system
MSQLPLARLYEFRAFERSVVLAAIRLSSAAWEGSVGRYLIRRCVKPIPRWVWLVGGLFFVAFAVSGCDDTTGAAQIRPVDVDVAPVLVRQIRSWDEFNGRITAIESVDIRPRVSGYVERVAYKEGDEIHRGDLLFTIDARLYQAAVDSAAARLQRAQALAVLAELRDQRAQVLLPSSAVSREEADTRRATYLQSKADVLDAEAALAVAKVNLEFTAVRAPIDGRVGRAMLTIGNLAVADQSVLTTMVSQDPIYVYFDPDEHSYLRYLATAARRQVGTLTARVGLANEDGFSHSGSVDFVDNKVDPQTGSIRLRARLNNSDRVFTPGLYARVQIAGNDEMSAILIDDKAVLTDQDRKYVYIVGPGDTAQRKDIKLGPISGGFRVVESGLTPGDKLIIGGLQRIYFTGAPVKPSEISMAKAGE